MDTLDSYHEMFELAVFISRQNDYDAVIHGVVRKAAELFHARSAAIVMLNPQTEQTLKTLVGADDIRDEALGGINRQLSGWMLKYNQPLISGDVFHDPRFHGIKTERPVELSVIGSPLMIEKKAVGALLVFMTELNYFNMQQIEMLEKLAVLISPYIWNLQQIKIFFDVPLSDDVVLKRYAAQGLLGRSQKFVKMLKTIEAASRSDVRVLLEGESGTGKELVARAIHQFSARQPGPFVAVDCGSFSSALIESELFGYVKGAFTGANQDRRGLIECAHRGTLFLDEIANLPLEMQAKLLRVIQEEEVRPVGGTRLKKVDIRIIAAASATLPELVEKGLFREDLFYRLYVYPVHIPTLNEREDDIPVLASHFLNDFAVKQGKSLQGFRPDVMHWMKARTWTGNIRELKNFVERVVTLAPKTAVRLTADYLPDDVKVEWDDAIALEAEPCFNETLSLREQMEAFEVSILKKALHASQGHQTHAARSLGLTEQMMRYKMKKFGIKRK